MELVLRHSSIKTSKTNDGCKYMKKIAVFTFRTISVLL